MKKYSIIIPHFNSSASLKVLLRSIPVTDDIQVIVVDDNSTVDADKLQEIINSNPHVEFHVNTAGVQSAGACRNIGLRYAEGKWVIFADADDYFLHDFHLVLERFFESSFDVIYFVPTSIELGRNEESKRHVNCENRIMAYRHCPDRRHELWLRFRYYSCWSAMIRRELLLKHNIDFEEVQVANDVMFSVKVGLCAEKIGTSQDVIYCITKSDTSLTAHVDPERLRMRRDVHVRRYLFLKEHLSPSDWKLLDSSGGEFLAGIITKKPGIAFIVESMIFFRKRGVRLFSRRHLNLVYLAREQRGK